MSTVEERLREEMGRAVSGVRPAPDPYGRLLRRKRHKRRFGLAAVVAVVAAALVGGQALTAGGPGPTAMYDFRPTLVLNERTRQIIDAPTRGDRADQAGVVAEALRDNRAKWGIAPEFDRLKVLFVARAGERWGFGAAFYDRDAAVFVGAFGAAGKSAAELIADRYTNTQTGDLSEFNAISLEDATVAFTVPGCDAQVAAASVVRADGTVEHSWVGEGDFAVLPRADHLWRVVCDGVVRETGFRNLSRARLDVIPAAERGSADAALAGGAFDSCPVVPTLDVRERRVLWGGTPPGENRSVVVTLGMLDGGAALVCAAAGAGRPMMAANASPYDLPAGGPDVPTGRLTTAVVASDALVTVRLPDQVRQGYSNRLLVIAPPAATVLRVTGGRDEQVTLDGGVGVIEAPFPARLGIQALDASGATLATAGVAEPSGAEFVIAGEPIIHNWE
ncbi:hypothetical protein ACQP00_40520 [Dactylosporangium sp. CS-047395]|uniref:hypothetical protein n=1 Tax=Dactylosporangium sp. CS-047395 TaxID=3239936 RepID=UPI003D936F93